MRESLHSTTTRLVNRLQTLQATVPGLLHWTGAIPGSICSAGESNAPSLDALLKWHSVLEANYISSLDGKVKVWSIEQRTCVATHSETDKALWSVKWLPKVDRTERFATAGSNHSIAFYREATGG
jgi:WD40 repeat protein